MGMKTTTALSSNFACDLVISISRSSASEESLPSISPGWSGGSFRHKLFSAARDPLRLGFRALRRGLEEHDRMRDGSMFRAHAFWRLGLDANVGGSDAEQLGDVHA